MSVRVTAFEGKVALYDSVTGLAFGPVFDNDDDAVDFLERLEDSDTRDPRAIPPDELAALKAEWENER